MIFHSISKENIEILEGIFAYLSEDGWKIPEWLQLLSSSAQ